MNFQESFPVFDLQLDCDFQSSDQKFSFQRKQNNSQTQIIDDGNVTALSTIGKRNANLDTVILSLKQFSHLTKDSCTLMGVYDGHGDDKVAKYLKQNLLQRLSEHKQFNTDIQTAIKSGIFPIYKVLQQIEEQVLQMFQKGSTVLLSVINDNQIIAANIGDSKMFGLAKIDGKLVEMTKQHDLSNHNEVAAIMAKGGLIFKRGNQYRINGQLNISRTIGDKKHKSYMSSQPDIYIFNKNQYKKIILATDGFYKHELFETELCKRSVKQIQNKIRKGVVGYGFDDNATMLAIKFKNASPNSTMQDFFNHSYDSISKK